MAKESRPQSPSPALSPDLAEFRQQFQAVVREARELVAGLSDAQLTWRPPSDQWSIAEGLNHLNTVGDRMRPILKTMIDEGRAQGLKVQEPYRPGLLARLFIYMMKPPYRIKLKSPPAFVAPPLQAARRAVETFFDQQERFTESVSAADGLDLNRLKAPSPANDKLRLSLGEWFAFLLAHERRHLWQARRVRDSEAFPRAETRWGVR